MAKKLILEPIYICIALSSFSCNQGADNNTSARGTQKSPNSSNGATATSGTNNTNFIGSCDQKLQESTSDLPSNSAIDQFKSLAMGAGTQCLDYYSNSFNPQAIAAMQSLCQKTNMANISSTWSTTQCSRTSRSGCSCSSSTLTTITWHSTATGSATISCQNPCTIVTQ